MNKIAMPSGISFRNRKFIWLTVFFLEIIHVGLSFWGLGDRVLWQDEAETAVLARNVLTFGWPLAWDGKNLVSQERWREFGPDYIWRWSGWIQIYLAALSFKIFGIGTFSARLPFTLVGAITPLATFLFVRKTFRDEPVALLAMAMLVFSVPFILFERQCRYYPILCLLSIFVNLGVVGIIQGSRWGYLCYVISVLIFMQTNHMNMVCFLASVVLSSVIIFRESNFLKRFFVINLLLVIPVIAIGHWQYHLFKQTEFLNLYHVTHHLEMAFSDTFTFFLSLPIALVLVYCAAHTFYKARYWSNFAKMASFIGFQVVLYMVFLSLSPQYFTRYLVCLIPLFGILNAIACLRIIRIAPIAGVLLTIMVLFTNWMNLYPTKAIAAKLGLATWSQTESRQTLAHPGIPLYHYFNELRTVYKGPDEGLVSFFKAHNNPSETVLISYGALPLVFYTDLTVHDGMGLKSIPDDFKPDWLVIRRHTRIWGTPTLRPLWTHEFIESNIDLTEYEPITIPYSDHKHGNRSDPRWHRFYNDVHPGNLMIIYKRKQDVK